MSGIRSIEIIMLIQFNFGDEEDSRRKTGNNCDAIHTNGKTALNFVNISEKEMFSQTPNMVQFTREML